MRVTSLIAAGVMACAAAGTGSANAGPVDDSWYATCSVLREDFTGDVEHDGDIALGVAHAIAEHYDVSPSRAVHILNAQVQTYCPGLWPELQAIGANARFNG